MSIDTMTMDYADDTFIRSMRAMNSMELADLPPELDQDARDIAWIILDHGPDYASTEHGDMTAPLLESLARLVQDNARLRGLLGAARCPNCDGSGAIPHGPTPDGDWEAEQCQWCYEKQEALAAGGDK